MKPLPPQLQTHPPQQATTTFSLELGSMHGHKLLTVRSCHHLELTASGRMQQWYFLSCAIFLLSISRGMSEALRTYIIKVPIRSMSRGRIRVWVINYLCHLRWMEVMFSPLIVYLSVCVSRITQKVINGFGWNLSGRLGGRIDLILVNNWIWMRFFFEFSEWSLRDRNKSNINT